MMELKVCPICRGGVEDKLILPYDDMVGLASRWEQKIAVCPKCGFVFTRNPFSDEQLANRYKYHSKFEFDSEDYFLEEEETYRSRSLRQKQFLERTLDLQNIHSIFEVGAASGYNLSLYRDTARTLGIEPSAKNCSNAAKRYGVELFCGTFAEYMAVRDRQTEKEKFDLVFLSHTLEHIVSPREFICQCTSMEPEYFFIEVPTFDYKFFSEPFGMFCEEHVNMFTLASLDALMCSCGYELADANMNMELQQTIPAGWPSVATIWKKAACPRRLCIVNKNTGVLDEFISASQKGLVRIKEIIAGIDKAKRLAVWGTGHHASMLAANTDLHEKNIVRVYDSDATKRGEKFLGCAIQPFDSADIEQGKVDAVLVATYTAQRAIEKILCPYKDVIEIITLYDV